MASLDRQDDVFVIDFGDDENQTNRVWVEQMNELLDEIEKTDAPAALVLTGRGKFFSAGLDTDYMAASPDEVIPYVRGVEQVCVRILVAPLPTVSAVNGHAFGIGAFLVIASDQALMREDRGWVCWPEIDLGMAFPRQMLALGRSRLDPRTLHEAFSSGRRYSAPEAIAAGFVAQAAPESELLERAIGRVGPLARQAGKTLGRIKQQLHRAVLEAGA